MATFVIQQARNAAAGTGLDRLEVSQRPRHGGWHGPRQLGRARCKLAAVSKVTRGALVVGAFAFASRRRQLARQAVAAVSIEVASEADCLGAAEVCARCLTWAKAGWKDVSNFSDESLQLIAKSEEEIYRDIYVKDRGCNSVLLVAKVDGKIVGCIGCEVRRYRKTLTGEEQVNKDEETTKDVILKPVMADLSVLGEYRGRSIGKDLVKKTEELVKSWGHEEIFLYVEDTNEKARGFYQKAGYVAIDVSSTVVKYLEVLQAPPPGRLELRAANAVLMRRSFREGLAGALDNVDFVALRTVAIIGGVILAAGQALLELGIVNFE